MDSQCSSYPSWQVATPTTSQLTANSVPDAGKRASRACENCRQKKIKCDESQPACRYCRRRKLVCSYRREHPARDPTLHLILEKLTQLHEEFRSLDVRVDTLENSKKASQGENEYHQLVDNPQSDCRRNEHETTQNPPGQIYRREVALPGTSNIAARQRISSVKPLPTSSVLRWKAVHDVYPTVSNRYIQDDLAFSYSATVAPPVAFPTTMTRPPNEPAQVFLYIRNFLDVVYPLYPIICEQAIYEMATDVIRDGVQINISSILVLLMTTLAKLYSQPSNNFNRSSITAELDNAVRLLSWLPLQYRLEHAQAYTLATLCFAKLSMLSTGAIYLSHSASILHEFLLRKVLVPSAIKLTTRMTSVRLYWVVLNLERDLSWETNIYSPSQLGQLENRLPLPFECMAEESSTPDSDRMHVSDHPVIDSCYSLFLAETSLRQILWRVVTAPELQESNLMDESNTESSTSLKRRLPPLWFSITTEIETQFSEWLACIPVSAAWAPTPCTGQVAPLNTRIRLQYWFGRFCLYRIALYQALNNEDNRQATDSLTLAWAHSAIQAGFNAISVFVLESFIPEDIDAHRILFLTIVLRSAIRKLGLVKIMSFCSTVTTTPVALLKRSILRLNSLPFCSAWSSPESLGFISNSYDNTTSEGMGWQSRWIKEDLCNIHTDEGNLEE